MIELIVGTVIFGVLVKLFTEIHDRLERLELARKQFDKELFTARKETESLRKQLKELSSVVSVNSSVVLTSVIDD